MDFTKQSIGCHMGHTFMGAFGYTDDIILLAPSKSCCLAKVLQTSSWITSQNSLQFGSSDMQRCSIDVQLHRRLLKFINSCVNSKNKIVKLCCTLALQDSGSYVSDSINFLASTYKFDKYNMPSVIKCNINSVHTDINIQNANVIKEFIAMREDIDIATSDKQNLTSIIDFLCTTDT